MAYWLMKSEPGAYSISDLKRDGTIYWDGVRNYQARNHMRTMQIGDEAFFYHSNCKIPGIVGIMKIVKTAYPDHTAFDPSDHHYDPKSHAGNPRWDMVDVAYVRTFPEIISLTQLRETADLESMLILRKGNRLSITPVSKTEWETILKLVE
ncbi:MAG: EVE domain-containing protein [Nitrospiria bacterium]